MQEYKVPYGLNVSVKIDRDEDLVQVIVIAPMYVNKTWTMSHCYSCDFTDYQILNDQDFVTVMLNHYPGN